ncbi:ferritin-like domain-containing protein [Sphingomonas xanthus]|uniref:PA2169 family four-helix-bundle protein n=1 Tax=Sphingomonas xanthus TaxID=2594473 RepID=A0A516ISN2_9SPHN|nr:PA2169 family four-helix-bundle protein [Sphingomonas xanthus]QDP19869.1 PA2169 family four-helix-bundle protein [Sphingomonas xanthus]
MPTNKDESLALLKTLADTVADSVNGYRHAAQHAEQPQMQSLFTALVNERDRTLRDMNKLLYAEGVDPDRDGTTLGYLHQRWLDFKANFAGRDDRAVIEEVLRGEEYLIEKLESALAAANMTADVAAMIERAHRSVQANRKQVAELNRSPAVQTPSG